MPVLKCMDLNEALFRGLLVAQSYTNIMLRAIDVSADVLTLVLINAFALAL